MEAADRLYGVTMEEEGVSKLVTVALDGEVKGAPKKLKRYWPAKNYQKN